MAATKSSRTEQEQTEKQHWRGWHERQNDRRASDYYNEPPAKKRRGEHAEATKSTRTVQEQTEKQEQRLMRLGFFEKELPTQHALEKAYSAYKKDVMHSSVSAEDKKLRIAKLTSAFRNITKVIQNRTPSPSTDEDDRPM